MNNTLSNKYFLQAYEAYPFNLTEVLESLTYALSYDTGHAGAHCLLGRLHMEHSRLYDKAGYHFEQALISDINYVATYEHYSFLLITLKEYEKAEKLIKYAYAIKGINMIAMQYREALINENRKNLKVAKKLMKQAFEDACNEEERNFLKLEVERIKLKFDTSKLKRKKNVVL